MNPFTIQFKHQLGEAIFDLDVVIPSTGVTVIFGRSGAGKSTLIHAIAGLITPQSGNITTPTQRLFDSSQGINIAAHKRRVGYVFQSARLFPHYKVKGNLMYGVKKADSAYFDKVVSMLSLEPLLLRYPADLSGGEKQRVSIGRALLSRPDILLMDEPLASLDLPRKKEIIPFLQSLATDVDIPIVYVTHSLDEVVALARHLVIVDQGRVVKSGPTEVVWASEKMRPWLGEDYRSSLFDAKVVSFHPNYELSELEIAPKCRLWVRVPNTSIGRMARIQIHAKDVTLAMSKPEHTSVRNPILAEIVQLQENTEETVLVTLSIGEAGSLLASITKWACEELQLRTGLKVYALVKSVTVAQNQIMDL